MCALFAATLIGAQPSSGSKPYKVVFDLTTDDPKDQAAVLTYIREIANANPDTDMEVVMYGRGTSLVVTGRSTMADAVAHELERGHLSFRVCEIAIRNQKIDKSQLLPHVTTVPDGIGEIVAKQNEGWGYIKVVAH
jgi:intracellular sulfur oxidation DsrE/DsrF family protein